MADLFGWLNQPAEVARQTRTLKCQNIRNEIVADNLINRTAGSDPVLPYLIARKIIGRDVPMGPQKIGDCVSWGWGNAANYVAIMQIAAQLNKLEVLDLRTNKGTWVKDARDHDNYDTATAILEEYQECCTEWIYGHSRVEVGKQNGSMEDGSVGAWAAKSVALGTASRKKYGPYDPKRAKEWGARGVPDDFEPEAKNHAFKEVAPVYNYNDAVTLVRAYRVIPICSDQGFTEVRDSKGRCRASGTWMHCMLICGIDADGWMLISQSWGTNSPTGPKYLDQPDNTFFAAPETVDRILKQKDSFTPSGFLGYQVEDFIDWKH